MTKDLTQGSPTKVLILFTLSMLATSMMSYVYGITDSIMVSRFVNTHAMGAISSILPVYSMLDGFLSATIGGFAIFAGRIFGAGDHARLRRITANGVLLSVVMVLPVTVLSCVFAGNFATLMNIPESFRGDAIAYFVIIMLGTPISAVTWFFAAMFRALGDSKSSLYRAAIGGALNVVFNFVFLKIIPMGVAGAALGTVCAALVNALMCLWQWRYRMPLLHFGKGELRFSGKISRILLSNGVPMGLLASVISVGSMILQIAINNHEETVITGISTGGKLLSLVWILIQNFEGALVYFCAQNLGAGCFDRVKKGFRSCVIIMLVLGGLSSVGSILFGEYFYRLFLGWDSDPETMTILQYAKEYIFTQVIFFPFMAGLCAPRGALKGIGNTVPAVACGVIELIARVIVSILSIWAPWDTKVKLTILYFAGPAAWIGATIFLLILIPRAFRRMEILYRKEREESREMEMAGE